MSIFSRLTDIAQANLNSMLDRAEDPEKMIRLIIQEMEDTLVEVRSSTVKIIADRKELERKIAELVRDEAEWERKAEVALTKGREDLAKGALIERGKVGDKIKTLTEQSKLVEEALAKANEDIGRLQTKLNDAKTRETALLARRQSAVARVKLRAKIDDGRINDALARFEQVERGLDEVEGRVESHDMGRVRSLSEEIADLEAESKVEAELAALRERVAARSKAE